MQKLHLSCFINAPREKVWDTMLNDATYRQWTSAFTEGSYYKGDWNEGSKIVFLGPGKDGEGEGGMVSRIKESRLHEFVSVEHLGEVHNGVEIMDGERVQSWKGALENYTFVEKDGGTDLIIEMDINESEEEFMEEAWEKGLEKLKALAEK